MDASAHTQSITLETLQKQVIREVLSAVYPLGVTRTLAHDIAVQFDPSLVWIVAQGTAGVEYKGKRIVTVSQNDIIGPWFASVPSLRIVAVGDSACELVGLRQDLIWENLYPSPHKMRLWSQFQVAMCNHFFREFAELQTASVSPTPTYRHYAPGETIILEGQDGREVFVLTGGAAAVSVRGDRVGEIHRDEVFGALAALTEGVRTATVVATEPCDCMVFPKQEFKELLRANPSVMEKLLKDVARALHDLNDSVVKAHHTKWQNLF